MEDDLCKIIVAHPGRQHSFRVATALQHYNLLEAYATTVYDKDSSILMRIGKIFLRGDLLRRAKKRKCPDVDDSQVIQFEELRGLLLLVLNRIDKKQIFKGRYNRYVSYKFQKKLAKYILKHNIKAVISYDSNSDVLFDILCKKAPDVVRIIDNAHPCRNYIYKIYNEKLEASGEFIKTYKSCRYLLDETYAEQFGAEAKKADIHIVASTFSQQASVYNGIDKEHIIVAPYGVDNVAFHSVEKDYRQGLKILFVGNITQRKGIYQILEASKQLSDLNIEFNLIGDGKELCPELYSPYEPYVNFLGRIPFEKMLEKYSINHVLVFPSMGDGFGLVILEALSSGLPVIASRNCSGPDIIKDGYNGFLIDAGDTAQLVDKIKWFYNHMEQLPQFQENAIQSAKEMTWENYEESLVRQLREKIAIVQREKANVK